MDAGIKANHFNRNARLVGSFFLISNIVFILGAVLFVEPVLSSPEYLSLASANRTQLVTGALLEIANAVAYLGIGALMFPVLRHRFEGMALAYFGLRAIEFVMQVLTDLSPLALVSISEEFAGAGAQGAASFQALGALLLAERSWAFQMISLTLGLGALLFYTMLFRTRLVPRWLAIWGLIGAAIVLANAGMDMYGLPPGNLGILMLLNEVTLGIWLIVRGFNPNAQIESSEIQPTG